jgi:hypothetical protein
MRYSPTVQAAVAEFPTEFGLKAFPSKRFRISPVGCYLNDDDVVQLVVQSLHHTRELPERERRGHNPDGYTWLDFSRCGVHELRQQISA